jgi:hypothetical protein
MGQPVSLANSCAASSSFVVVVSISVAIASSVPAYQNTKNIALATIPPPKKARPLNGTLRVLNDLSDDGRVSGHL